MKERGRKKGAKRVSPPENLEETAKALQGLMDVESLLSFPEPFLANSAGELRAVARYFLQAAMPWDTEWGPDLRAVGIRQVARVVVKALTGGYSQFIATDIPKAFRETVGRQVLIYEAVCAVNFGCSMRLLWADLGIGKEEALWKLLRIDKSFLTMPHCRHLIKQAQHQGNWVFFERVGKAVAAPPLSGAPYQYGAVLLTACYWDEYFSKITHPENVKILESHGLLPANVVDPRSFGRQLTRLGLIKDSARH